MPEHLKQYQFGPGQSGNPGGRAKGVERRYREAVGPEEAALIYVQRCIALCIPPDPDRVDELLVTKLTTEQRTALGKAGVPTYRDAIMAHEKLQDRANGKPKQNVKIEDGASRVPTPWDSLPLERRRELLATFEELGLLDEGPAPDGPTEH